MSYNRIKGYFYFQTGNNVQIGDLKKIVHLAQTTSIQKSALALNITPGALSKTLKKIEHKLCTSLFDRTGRNIVLNGQGKKFIVYAVQLIHDYEQMCSEFTDNSVKSKIKLTGPSVLLGASLAKIAPMLVTKNIELSIETQYEGDAIKQLVSGGCHLAVITEEALVEVKNFALQYVFLGATRSKVIAAPQHALFNQFPDGKVSLKTLLEFGFICPKTSPFCGAVQGVGSDGWQDHIHPRKIIYRSDDLNSLLAMVSQGNALAYVPDTVINRESVTAIDISSITLDYQERYYLVYRASTADGWLNQLITKLKEVKVSSR